MPRKFSGKCAQCNKDFYNTSQKFCGFKCYNKFRRTNKLFKEEGRVRMLRIRSEYQQKTGKVLGFTSENNPGKNPTWKQRLSQFRKGAIVPEKTRRKVSRSMKRALKDPALREKWSKAQMGRKMTEETKQKIKKTRALRPKKVSTLKKNLDGIFSIYIRTKYSPDGIYVSCFTCGKTNPIREMDNGHYVGRGCLSLRYSEKNCHPQCRSCNRFHEGMKDSYSVALIEKYGDGILQELQKEKQEIKKMSTQEYESLTEHYKKKVDKLLAETPEVI